MYSEKSDKHSTGFTSNFEQPFASDIVFDTRDCTRKYRPWKALLDSCARIRLWRTKVLSQRLKRIGRIILPPLQTKSFTKRTFSLFSRKSELNYKSDRSREDTRSYGCTRLDCHDYSRDNGDYRELPASKSDYSIF